MTGDNELLSTFMHRLCIIAHIRADLKPQW